MLTQWYIKLKGGTPNVVNNYFPWKTSYYSVTTEGFRQTHGMRQMNTLPPTFTGAGKQRTKLKKIRNLNGLNTPVKKAHNVFIMEHDGNSTKTVLGDNEYSWLGCLPEDIIKWLKKYPFVSIVLVISRECHLVNNYNETVTRQYEEFSHRYGLSNNLILGTCAVNPEEAYKGFTLRGNVEWLKGGISYNQHIMSSRFKKEDLIKHCTLAHEPRLFNKKLVNYNHRWRLSRCILFKHVYENTPSVDLLYSLQNGEDQAGRLYVLEFWLTQGSLPDNIIKFIKWVNTKYPSGNVDGLNLSNEFEELPAAKSHLPNIIDYKNTFCDVVSETNGDREFEVHDNMLFFTEKVIKPMLGQKPFLVNANPGYLKYLKELGFKTFDKWFDESYDSSEYGLIDSLEIIKKNIVLINSKSYEELFEIYKEMKPILVHNYRKALEFIYDDPRLFIENLYTHLETKRINE